MESHGTTHRAVLVPNYSTSSSSSTTDDLQPYDPKESTQKNPKPLKLIFHFPFNFPLSLEAAGLRVAKSLAYFGLYYTLFVWIILFISLIPLRKNSLILLVIMTYVTTMYLLLLREFPNSALLHRIIDKGLVLFVLAIVTTVELIMTNAGLHLAVTLACALPIVSIHAIFWINDDVSEGEEVASIAGELAPLIGDQKNSETVSSDHMV
ncbi:PRA1 family protein [Quillaja saponaria]|uniref:PRA1 family protein n=1 Tax=Quillaja saponaria TaxID=32244 RepID=A0AAD7LPK3_QUISA|nr:PRA1 family protein [Quillaja saponaria]